MLLVLEEQYGAMADSPPSLRLILNRVDALLPVPSSAASVPLPRAKSEKISDETISEMTRVRQTVQKWLVRSVENFKSYPSKTTSITVSLTRITATHSRITNIVCITHLYRRMLLKL